MIAANFTAVEGRTCWCRGEELEEVEAWAGGGGEVRPTEHQSSIFFLPLWSLLRRSERGGNNLNLSALF